MFLKFFDLINCRTLVDSSVERRRITGNRHSDPENDDTRLESAKVVFLQCATPDAISRSENNLSCAPFRRVGRLGLFRDFEIQQVALDSFTTGLCEKVYFKTNLYLS